VTLPSVKTTYTERESLDGKHVEVARKQAQAEESAPGFSGGVPFANRKSPIRKH
jgi:hypothetical protein